MTVSAKSQKKTRAHGAHGYVVHKETFRMFKKSRDLLQKMIDDEASADGERLSWLRFLEEAACRSMQLAADEAICCMSEDREEI